MKAITTSLAKDLRVQHRVRLSCTLSAYIHYSLVCCCWQIHWNCLQYVKSNIMTRLLSQCPWGVHFAVSRAFTPGCSKMTSPSFVHKVRATTLSLSGCLHLKLLVLYPLSYLLCRLASTILSELQAY
uniref:Uncharacterized protein n=1 Tax=Monopterus albus TaxID=43700 RepID=A0A3Q3JML1_MONAL